MIRITLKYIAVILIIGFFSACNKDKGPYSIAQEIDVSVIDSISYIVHVQPIFDANCINCHNASHSKLDLQSAVSYNQLLYTGFSASYVNVSNPPQSKLYLHLTGALAIMPPSGAIQQSEQDLVLKWIEQGALDN